MTTVASGARPAGRWRPSPPASMGWAVWRQHRTALFTNRWHLEFFDSTALTAVTAALLAFAIDVLAGALIRWVVPAMAVTAACAITVADLAYNRLHYWLVGQGLRLTRDQALGATPNVGIPLSGPVYIHEPAGPPCRDPPEPGWTRAGTPPPAGTGSATAP